MKYVLTGLGLSILGFLVWVVSSIFAAVTDFAGDAQPWFGEPLMYASGMLMFVALPAGILYELAWWFYNRYKKGGEKEK